MASQIVISIELVLHLAYYQTRMPIRVRANRNHILLVVERVFSAKNESSFSRGTQNSDAAAFAILSSSEIDDTFLVLKIDIDHLVFFSVSL